MKTLVLKPADVSPRWWLIDADDLVVGRLSTRVATILMGKHRPDYTPHVLCGDVVVLVNVEKVKFTGKKWARKIYDKYTGYPSGRKTIDATSLRAKSPETIVRHAVRRMLPKSKLGRRMLGNLKIYAGPAHPHQAQQPEKLELNL